MPRIFRRSQQAVRPASPPSLPAMDDDGYVPSALYQPHDYMHAHAHAEQGREQEQAQGPHDTDDKLDWNKSEASHDYRGPDHDHNVGEKPEVKLSKLDQFAGQVKGYGDLSNIDPDVAKELFDNVQVRESFTSRQLAMISLSGSVGTGIFLSVGKALAHAGPLSLFLGYSIVGVFACCMLFCQAELSTLAPVNGYYVRHSGLFVSKALAFSSGWSMIYSNFVGLPGEFTAAATLIQYWTDVNSAVFITVFGVVLLATTLVFTRIYSETEYGFSIIKLTTAIGLVIFCICLDLGAGPNGHMTGFQYWRNPGPMVSYLAKGAAGRWYGLWYTLTNAAYSYQGIETICAAAAETRNPRQALPRAAKRVFVRVGAIYVLLVFCVGLIVPSNDPRLINASGTASASPYVVAASNAGIKVLPSILNAVMLTSAYSSAAAGTLSSSRSAMALAHMGYAPKAFLKTHRWGVPWVAVLVVTCGFPLGYTVVSSSATKVFGYFQSIISSLALYQWSVICIISLRVYYAMKKQGIPRSALPWQAWGQPYTAWIGLGGAFFCLFTGGFEFFLPGGQEAQTFISAYCAPIINICLLLGFKLWTGTRLWIPLDEVPIEPWLTQFRQNPEPVEKKPKGLIRIISWIWF